MDIVNIIKESIEPELLILVPVLFGIGYAIKKTEKISDNNIPLILGIIGILLSALYVVANMTAFSVQEVLIAIFTAVAQGVLVAAGAVYIDQLIKQQKYKSDTTGLETEETIIVSPNDNDSTGAGE